MCVLFLLLREISTYLQTQSTPTTRTFSREKAGDVQHVVIIGGGPVGLSLALLLAEWVNRGEWRGRVTLYEQRVKEEGGTLHWRELPDGNRRREQVVTLQDRVVDLFPENFRGLFEGERVWASSRNVAIRHIEDRLLDRLQHDDMRRHVQIHPLPSEIRDAVRRSRGSAPDQVYRNWIANLPGDVIVAADGSNSLTRQCEPSFEWKPLGGGEGAVETDYSLGLALADDMDGLPASNQALNVVLTLAQTR